MVRNLKSSEISGKFVIGLIRIYQGSLALARAGFAPIPFSCRFTPSCSNYMIESVKSQGVLKGLQAGFLRLLSCRPGVHLTRP